MQSEVKFQELMKYAGDSIFMTNLNFQIIAMNESACELLGYSKEELQHMKIVELMTKEEQKTFASRIKIINTEGGSVHERAFVKKDGSLVETEVNVRAIKGIGYISVIRDITERKETEIKIRESEERYKSIISVSKTGGWEFHGVTDFLWCSEEYFLMLGRKQSDYDFSGAKNLKETWIDLLHPEDRERSINHFAEYLKNGSVGTYESYFRMLHANGSWVWIWSRGQTLRDAEGKLTPLTVGTHIDITERKKIERELTEKKEQLSLFIEHSPASLAMFDTDMRYIATSRRWTNDYNIGNQNVIGKTHYEVFPEITQVWKDIHQRCLKGAVERSEEDSFERLDGSKEWIRWEIRPWHKSSGEIGGIIMFTEVITERKESELLFKNLVEKSLVGVFIVQKGKFVYVNPKFAQYLGYAEEEMLKIDNFRQIVDDSYTPAELEQWREKVDTGIIEDFHIELKYKRKDGQIIWADVFCGETIYKGGKAILGSFQDITERKNSEAAIKEQAEIFTAIIENANEAIWLLSPDLTVLQFNKTLQERIRLNGGKEIYLGANFKDFLYSGSENQFMTMFNEALKGNYPEKELCQTNIHGKLFWIRTRMYPVYDTEKKLIGIAILTENITERKAMEAERQKILDEMMQRNRDLEQFTYIVSHNLRAPVANIIGISNYMQNTEMDSKESEEMNNGLRTSVLKLDGVINDLNNILKVKREISEKKETVKFSDLVNNIKTSIVNLIEKEEVTFITDFNAVEEMETIKSYLHSIFYNLISNSIKYRRPDVAPVIEIKTALVEDKLEITYKDNGLGIDLEKKGDQVFGLYKRFHTHAEGKGMGLYMVKTQVETLGGTISLESEINKGTEFKIKFEIEKNNN
ncbi:PAS domain S-box protein [Flavobacterium terrigena]|nr:PAS domain S-box protein [Flavobacterium terrigena]